MSNFSWLDNPAIKNMDPRKLTIIVDLINEAGNKPLNKTLPYLMKANAKLKEHNLSFTPEETTILMQILTTDMSPEEKEKLNNLRAVMESKVKENKR